MPETKVAGEAAPSGGGHPFYVVAPPYDEASAGNRVLYTLAEQLDHLGYESFVVIHEHYEPIAAPLPPWRRVRYLTPELAKAHFEAGRAPVVVYPEISTRLSPVGVRVFYLLNYVGLMGGPERLPDCEFVLSYSQNIARSSPRSDGTLYVPVSDPDFWTPDLNVVRRGACVYAGKYVDHHRQQLPPELEAAFAITRHQPDSPTRAQIREIFRRSERFYVFENTALATEAALCGCPVVYRLNPFFPELIAEHELGLDGFTADDSPAGVAAAAEGVQAFRRSYLRTQEALPTAVAEFAERAQALAEGRAFDNPFEVRALRPSKEPLKHIVPETTVLDGASLDRKTTPEDVAHAYLLAIGRAPETAEAVAAKLQFTLGQVLKILLDSEEFLQRAPLRVTAGEPALVDVPTPSPDLLAWAVRSLPLTSETRSRLPAAGDWHALAYLIFSDPQFRDFPEGSAGRWAEPEFLAALEARARSGERNVLGGIDVLEPHRVRGWAFSARNPDQPIRVEVYADGAFAGAGSTGQVRRDLQDRFGGNGLYGFSIDLDLSGYTSSPRPTAVEVRDAVTGQVLGAGQVHVDPQPYLDALGALRSELAGVKETLARIERSLPDLRRLSSFSLAAYGKYHRRFYTRTPRDAWDDEQAVEALGRKPRFSVVLLAEDGAIGPLEQAIRSLGSQAYREWELLVVAPNATPREEVAELAVRFDSNRRGLVRVLGAGKGGGAAERLNQGLAEAAGEVVIFLDEGARLAPAALLRLARAIQEHPAPRLLYWDDDRAEDDRVEHQDPRLKPPFDHDLLLQRNYIGRTFAANAELCRAVGGFRTGYEEAEHHDLLLRLSEAAGPLGVRHLPQLLHSRAPESAGADAAGEDATLKAVNDHLDRIGRPALAEPHTDIAGPRRRFTVRIRARDLGQVTASVLIPTRDKPELIGPCVESLLATRDRNRASFEITIIDNAGQDPGASRFLNALAERQGVRLLRYDAPFNWAAINNFAANQAASDVLVFLNDDTLALSPDWCDELCMQAMRAEVGAVGVRLLYEDATIQHAGMLLNGEGSSLHEGVGEKASDGGYLDRHALVRRVSAVTGACMATRRELFQELGGFDALNFPVTFNDLDYCLRTSARGLRVLYTPHASFYHLESKSRGFDHAPEKLVRHERERRAFVEKWPDLPARDPFYNPHFESMALPFTRLRAPPEG